MTADLIVRCRHGEPIRNACQACRDEYAATSSAGTVPAVTKGSRIMDRTDEELDEQLNRAAAHEEAGTTDVPGMTYEQGVDRALRWATGQTDDEPIETDGDDDENDEEE